MIQKEIIKGWISEREYCENDGLCINGEFLSEMIESDALVTIRYYISDTELTESELLEQSILSLSGYVYAEHQVAYSEYTGYLWTDDILKIGGHDLLSELYEFIGKYLWLEIEYHNKSI